MAFTDYETEQLRKALLKETRHCAVTLGMKKTSVDQLTKAVGIAKGSFYKFYESKEMLFFCGFGGHPRRALRGGRPRAV
ncbi:MAG: TetR/AcrR family transcriptional regulator [Oscillospiraceae bacterium]